MSVHKDDKKKDQLRLGDYVMVRNNAGAGDRPCQQTPGAVMLQHEYFFQRILKQRGQLVSGRQRHNSVINVRNRRSALLPNTSITSKAG